MAFGAASLSGLNMLPGYNAEYDASLQQAGNTAYGRTLQLLSQQQAPNPGNVGMPQQQSPAPQMPGPPPGMPPMTQGGPQMGAPPPQPQMPPQGMPRMGGPPIQNVPQPPMQPQMPGPGQGPPQMPQGQPMGYGPQMGMPQQQGQQGPALDWRVIMQKVSQANPGAPPQVLAAAVDKFLPLMNQQSQMQWKEIGLQMRAQQMQMQQDYRDRSLQDRERALSDKESGAGAGVNPEDATSIAKAVEAGQQPPTLQGLYRMGAPVRAQLAKDGFDLSSAQQEWERAKKLILSLNGPQQTRFTALGNSVVNTIDEVNRLGQQLQQSGIQSLNKAKLALLIQARGNTPLGQLATKYVTSVGTLKEEFANLAQGGYAPTEPVWNLANSQINENYGVDQLGASLGEIQRLINYRLKAQEDVGGGGLGPSAPNRYTNQKTGEQTDKSGWSKDDPLGIR